MQKRKEKKNFLKQKFTFFNNLFLENMYGGCLTILIFSCGINNKMHQCLFHENLNWVSDRNEACYTVRGRTLNKIQISAISWSLTLVISWLYILCNVISCNMKILLSAWNGKRAPTHALLNLACTLPLQINIPSALLLIFLSSVYLASQTKQLHKI